MHLEFDAATASAGSEHPRPFFHHLTLTTLSWLHCATYQGHFVIVTWGIQHIVQHQFFTVELATLILTRPIVRTLTEERRERRTSFLKV